MNPTREQRRLSAILAADVVGYTRLIEHDTEGTVSAWKSARTTIIDPTVSKCSGRVVKLTGDGFLAEFLTVQDAVRCAIEMQERLQGRLLDFRMGINIGDVIDDGEDIHGEGVNIAARIEALAEPRGICVSAAVFEQVRNRVEQSFEDLGEHEVKHVSAPVRVYRVVLKVPASNTSDIVRVRAEMPAIAVLSFDNMSGDPEQEYFSDGITEDIITALSRFRWFSVTARNSTFSYKGKSIDVKQIARELDVRYVLEGSVRKAGERVRVTAQLIDAEDGNHIWAERYDRSIDDIFELQDEMTRTVVGAIEPEISRVEQDRAMRKSPGNLDAWDNYQHGMHCFYQGTLESFNQAEQYFDRAINLDSNFAAAYGMYARTFTRRSSQFLLDDSEFAYERAINAARRAVALDPGDAATHVAMGFALELADIPAAVASFEEALSLNPDSSLAHFGLGRMLILAKEPKRGVEHLLEAISLSPRDSLRGLWYWSISEGYFALGEFDLVVEWSSKAIRSTEFVGRNVPTRIAALALIGDLSKANDEREAYISQNPSMTMAHLCARTIALSGNDQYRRGLRLAGFPDN
jgi:adenylate cyclase